MSLEKSAINVETIEAEAEKIIQMARSRASEILMKANEEANNILNSRTALEPVKVECENILQKAKKESEARVEEARIKATVIKGEMSKKGQGLVSRMVNEITGVNVR